jgi:isoquinoline 1-oxidoreductase beta subunit
MDGNLPPTAAPSRRAIVTAGLSAAGGLMIGVPLARAAGLQPAMLADGTNPAKEMTAFLVIEPDNAITIRVPHAEMGQGTTTGLAMLVAEELECDWTKVRIEYASANRNQRAGGNLYGRMQTVGSQGLRTSVRQMQQAGASARERLRMAAAEKWNVNPADCAVGSGKCLHKASNRSLDYGALAASAATVQLASEPAIKPPSAYKLVGKWTPRLDTPAKLDGSAKFGIDAQIPGMVYAAVWSSPVYGGALKSVDEAPARAVPGVITVVKLADAVVVVADRYWRAKKGLDALKIQWDAGPYGGVQQADLEQGLRDALDGPTSSTEKKGDPEAALAAPGAKLVEATYEAPFLSHSPMEPMNCTVKLAPDRVDVWLSTQAPMAVLASAAKEAGVAPENVYVHNHFVGGGFGRRGGNHDELIQAVAVAKAVGKPVKLIWSREQDIRRDRYRPQAAVRFRSALDAAGQPTVFQARVAVPSLLRPGPATYQASEPMATECIQGSFYAFPARDVAVVLKNSHVPVSFWRGVGSSQNGFFVESFMDELAHAAGADPLAYRRALLTARPDALGVIDALKARSDWGQPLPKGRGRGVAIIEAYGSVSGQVAEVTVSKDGKLRVDRVTCALDPYHVANPNTVTQQMEGAVIMGLSAALWGEITIKDGAPVQSNFHDYRMVRYAETPPRIEVVLTPSGGGDGKWGGVGEPGIGPLAPAVANAIFAATGKRVRKLPLSHADLSWA